MAKLSCEIKVLSSSIVGSLAINTQLDVVQCIVFDESYRSECDPPTVSLPSHCECWESFHNATALSFEKIAKHQPKLN